VTLSAGWNAEERLKTMMDVLHKNPGVLVEELDDEVVLYKPSSHEAIHLNGSAAVIWKLCDGTRTTQALINCLVDQYPAAESEIAAEVQQAIDELLRHGV
jgi:hypothetical protein